MSIIEHLGRYSIPGRELYVLDIKKSQDLPAVLDIESPYFVCVLAWDTSSVSVEEVVEVAKKLLKAGAVYVCTWGVDCERVHDIFDEVSLDIGPPYRDENLIMTTWHSNDPLEEAIWFALYNTYPAEDYEDSCGAVLGVSIGSDSWAAVMRKAFADPEEFIASCVD